MHEETEFELIIGNVHGVTDNVCEIVNEVSNDKNDQISVDNQLTQAIITRSQSTLN